MDFSKPMSEPDAGAHASAAAHARARCPASLLATPVLALMLSACGDQPPPEAAQVPVEPRRAVSADEQAFRDAVIASVTTIDPELASQTRIYYRAMDAGERSRAVRDAGGLAHVRSELRAAELYHFAHKLDACVADVFDARTPRGAVRLIERLAAGKHGAALIADAKRYDPDGYAFDLTGYGDRPNQAQRVAAAYDTLSVHWRTIGTKQGSDEAVKVFAETMLRMAAVTDGKCIPDPKLHTLLDTSP